jgi:hypothetical protein
MTEKPDVQTCIGVINDTLQKNRSYNALKRSGDDIEKLDPTVGVGIMTLAQTALIEAVVDLAPACKGVTLNFSNSTVPKP